MTLTAIAADANSKGTGQAIRRWWWRHPEAVLVAIGSVAWVALFFRHMDGHNQPASDTWSFDPLWWSVMVAAMMLPAMLPMYHQLAHRCLWSKRHRWPMLFTAAYVLIWAALGVAAALGVRAVERLIGSDLDVTRTLLLVCLLAAALWQMSAAKARLLRGTHLTRSVPLRGWKAAQATLQYSALHARYCIGSCGAIMAVMFFSGHNFHLMVPLSIVSVVERYQLRPSPRIGAAFLVVIAAQVAIFGV